MIAVDKQTKREHAARRKWNEYMIARMGLTCTKENTPAIKSISVWQGELRVYHDEQANTNEWLNHIMHCQLENFLLSYFKYLKQFEGVVEFKKLENPGKPFNSFR